jgi:hypothetical protein
VAHGGCGGEERRRSVVRARSRTVSGGARVRVRERRHVLKRKKGKKPLMDRCKKNSDPLFKG